MPDVFFSAKDEVPEGLREFAKELEDGKFSVNVVPQVKLTEFRDNNINLAKERDSLKDVVEKINSIFPEFDFEKTGAEVGELRGIAQRVKDGQLAETKGLETALDERTREMRKSLEEQISSKAKEAADFRTKYLNENQKYKRTLVDRAILDVILDEKSGVHASAKDDILNRAYGVWNVGDDGSLTPKQGDAILYGADGSSAMSTGEWVGSLKDKNPHLFKGSSGGGSGGSGSAADKKFGGFNKQDYDKLSPLEKLRIANEGA